MNFKKYFSFYVLEKDDVDLGKHEGKIVIDYNILNISYEP